LSPRPPFLRPNSCIQHFLPRFPVAFYRHYMLSPVLLHFSVSFALTNGIT
jgi:hypothetical protein